MGGTSRSTSSAGMVPDLRSVTGAGVESGTWINRLAALFEGRDVPYLLLTAEPNSVPIDSL